MQQRRRDFGTEFEKDEPTDEPGTSMPVPDTGIDKARLEQWLAEQRAKNAARSPEGLFGGQDVAPMAQPSPMTWEQQLAASRPADYDADPRMQTTTPAFKIWRGGTASLPARTEQPLQYPWREPYDQGT